MEVRPGGLDTPQVVALLAAHVEDMRRYSPPESVHTLDLDRLRAPDLTFWSAWEGEEVLGCGALRELDPRHGELKSMRTAPEHRGRGVGSLVLEHLVATARSRGYARLSLETGSPDEFAPARRLYARRGFVECGPFGPYAADDFSVFMTFDLSAEVGASPDSP
ncbi:GNAT family N-acetyltransferase [Pedococcus ginsenosidimutans]|uniref:GNAT family N-acetyltransferase n=1 Tax=Pedococcus ginsenosidimutans TaxID=490570 RepID=A0ABP8YNC9_9MICO